MKKQLLTALVAIACLAGSAAFAGGPLYIYDPETRTPYAWAGDVPVYTDQGMLGILTNEQADQMTADAWQQWNQVPTSTMNATIMGDLASIGLPDIDATNFEQVVGVWNGGGVHILYDADGSLFTALFGHPYIYGVTIIEFVDENSSAILEATVILNGAQVPSWFTPEEAMAKFGGVATHEYGHAIGLAHSQTNGAVVDWRDWDPITFTPNTGAAGCPAPYEGSPWGEDIETMYPFVNIWSTAQPMQSVDITDDISTLSEIYPVPGWEATPTITGRIHVSMPLLDDEGSDDDEDGDDDGHTDGEYTGANVIARNIDNPWRDAISALSGDYTQGMLGPDGLYTFRGLTQGATYAIYVDGIWGGAFSTPIRTVLPGPEEFFNGVLESGNGLIDDRCAVEPVAVVAGSPSQADIFFNRIPGAPVFHPIELPTSGVSSITQDGSMAVGSSDAGIFRWTPEGGYELLGGSYRALQPSISPNGQHIVSEVFYPPEDYLQVAGLWQGGEDWMELGGLEGTVPCGDGNWSSAWGVADNGTVVGLAWDECTWTTAYSWTPEDGMVALPQSPDSTFPGSRANAISGDGSTIVGWDRDSFGFWRGSMWKDGGQTIFTQDPIYCWCDPDVDPTCEPITEIGNASAVTYDGSTVVGETYSVLRTFVDPWSGWEYEYCASEAWMWTEEDGARTLGEFYVPGYRTIPSAISDDGKVIGGVAFGQTPWDPRYPLFWTEATGYIDFTDFLNSQGTYAQDWLIQVVQSISGDGKTLGGWAATPFSFQGFVVEMDEVVMCHINPDDPTDRRTIVVDFPDGMACHLEHGSLIGHCGMGSSTGDDGDFDDEYCDDYGNDDDDEDYDDDDVDFDGPSNQAGANDSNPLRSAQERGQSTTDTDRSARPQRRKSVHR